MNLVDFFNEHKKVALAFSGGVDSTYLLSEAIKLSVDIKVYYVKTPFQPAFENNDVINICKKFNINCSIIETSVLDRKEIIENSSKRCYYCKKFIFTKIIEQGKNDGYFTIIDGTNASDSFDDRPGMVALEELSIFSPLRIAGLTKDDIRKLSKDSELSTWNKPSYSCLATRVKQNETITAAVLDKIEKAENEIFKLGFSDFRVRVSNNFARLEFKKDELKKVDKKRDLIINLLKKYFDDIEIDKNGR